MAAATLIFSTVSSTSCCWKARCSSVVLPRSACLQSSSCGFRCVRFPQSQIHLLKARRRPALACAARTGRRRQGSSSSKIKKKRIEEDDAAAEAALEALFLQLEKDLELDGESGEAEDDDDITEEEMIAFEQELNAVLGLGEDDEDDGEGDDEAAEEGEVESENGETGLLDMVMKDGIYGHTTTSHPDEDQKLKFASNGRLEVKEYSYDSYEDEDDDYDEEDEEEEEEQRTVKLEKWQLKKLAVAVEKGRRRVNVKSLAADVRMDRSDVLSFLRDPPLDLLVMSASLEDSDSSDDEDESAQITNSRLAELTRTRRLAPTGLPDKRIPKLMKQATLAPGGGAGGPQSWQRNKRLRKEHIATFERVYRQSKRPSNAMIENLVMLTHVPRQKILQWFDEQRSKNETRPTFEDAL
ncbi:hypothetical protein BDL97_07G031700 [Sphagnum fallax]|nr:hypothetical protein BDL97_07G031700 [Sphagnum fallax]